MGGWAGGRLKIWRLKLITTQVVVEVGAWQNINMLVSGRKTKTSYPTTALVFGYSLKSKAKQDFPPPPLPPN